MTGANLSSEMSLHLDIVLAPTSDIIQHIAVTFLMFKAFCFADKNLTQLDKTAGRQFESHQVKEESRVESTSIGWVISAALMITLYF